MYLPYLVLGFISSIVNFKKLEIYVKATLYEGFFFKPIKILLDYFGLI